MVIATLGVEQVVEFGATQHIITFRRVARHPAFERRIHGLRHIFAQRQQLGLEARRIQPTQQPHAL